MATARQSRVVCRCQTHDHTALSSVPARRDAMVCPMHACKTGEVVQFKEGSQVGAGQRNARLSRISLHQAISVSVTVRIMTNWMG